MNLPPIYVLKRMYPKLTGGAGPPAVGGNPTAPTGGPEWGAASKPAGRNVHVVPQGGRAPIAKSRARFSGANSAGARFSTSTAT